MKYKGAHHIIITITVLTSDLCILTKFSSNHEAILCYLTRGTMPFIIHKHLLVLYAFRQRKAL